MDSFTFGAVGQYRESVYSELLHVALYQFKTVVKTCLNFYESEHSKTMIVQYGIYILKRNDSFARTLQYTSRYL
jgi:hypothetical protein